MPEPRDALDEAIYDFQLRVGNALLAGYRALNRFFLKVGERIVKAMDWMNE